MNRPLPNYFLADLPPDAVLVPRMVVEACQSLRRNRQQFLATKTTSSIVQLLADLAELWRQPDYPFRQRALREGPAETGFSAATLEAGLDGFFRNLTVENLHTLIQQDLGSLQRLDGFSQSHSEIQERRSAWARGPELIAHVAAGNLPNPALTSLTLGLLTRSAQFMKCARGGTLIPRLFAHSLYEAEPKLAACLEIAHWPGGSESLEEALFSEATLITATGSDETLETLRHRIPKGARLMSHGHRVSFGYITSEALNGLGWKRLVQKAAADVAAWDQQGCLSPHVLYVEPRGAIRPEQFAELLATELQRREEQLPRGGLSVEESAAITSRRAFYEVRAAHSPETRIWCSPQSTAWTVVYETDPLFQPSCLNRFIHVKAVKDPSEALRYAESARGKVSTVGLGVPPEQAASLAQQFARWGVTRLCSLGQMQNPPLTWRHDGRPALGDLVEWTDWEQS